MKAIKTIFIGLVVVILVVVFGKNIIAKAALESGVTMVTGLPLKMEKFDFSLTKSQLDIDNLQLLNPKGYPEKVMVDLPDFFVSIDLGSVIGGKMHIKELRLHLKEVALVKNKDGEANIDKLLELQKKMAGDKKPKEEAPKEKKKAPEIQIDKLILKIEKAYIKDYSKGDKPRIQEYPLNVNKTFENITDPSQIIGVIVMELAAKMPLAMISNVNIDFLGNVVGDVSGTAQKLAGDAKAIVGKGTEQLAGATSGITENISGATDSLKGATDGIKDTASALKEKIKLPSFGSGE